MATHSYDVVVIGAGAAGLMCAIEAGKRGRRVAVLEHQKQVGRKILVSGGGRCNFTNLRVSSSDYVSENPHFPKSALSRYRPGDFISLVRKHGIPFHEKKLGQLFCDGTAGEIVRMLVSECASAGVEIRTGQNVESVSKYAGFVLKTPADEFTCESLVVATGGLSIPKAGATDLGLRIARQFGLATVPTFPALDGFVFDDGMRETFSDLAGVSADSVVSCRKVSFHENILFTHVGLSGPAALQASLYWTPGETILVNLSPDYHVGEWLIERKQRGSRLTVSNQLTAILPSRLAWKLTELWHGTDGPVDRTADAELRKIGDRVNRWLWVPASTVGYSKAEVTKGGIDTNELSSQTMESRRVPGLYFVGEVVDVTGKLGGYNFQWAWSSGFVCGQFV